MNKIIFSYSEHAYCPLCKKIQQTLLYCNVQNPRNIGRSTYDYLRCKECGLVFLDPMPSRNELDKVYTSIYDFYEENKNDLLIKISSLLSMSRNEIIITECGSKGRILDIGCGTGTFLQKMKEKNWDVYGIEITEWAGNKAKERVGDDRILISNFPFADNGKSHERIFPNNYFDVITLWHVLEHVECPICLTKEIYRLLKTSGLLIIEVPNLDSLSLKIFQNKYSLHRVPEHLTYWSKDSLKLLLENNNYKIESISYPIMMPLTFSKSFLKFLSKEENMFAKQLSCLSIPLALISIGFGMMGYGEILRVIARKEGNHEL